MSPETFSLSSNKRNGIFKSEFTPEKYFPESGRLVRAARGPGSRKSPELRVPASIPGKVYDHR